MDKEIEITARRSTIKRDYYLIYFNGSPSRVCPINKLHERYPTAKILDEEK